MARSQFPYLPIVAISALAEEEWRDKCFEAGASCFIPKPIRLDVLLDELDLIQKSQVDLAIAVMQIASNSGGTSRLTRRGRVGRRVCTSSNSRRPRASKGRRFVSIS